jgi:hypothetical protein
MSTDITFSTGFVMNGEAIVLAGAADDLPPFAPFTRIFQLNLTNPPYWWAHDENWRTCAISYFGTREGNFDDAVVLSEEGDVQYLGDHPPLKERIHSAGVFNDNAQGWGYLADIQQIGEHLYACGYKGQVYKRFGKNDWRHIDVGLLQDPKTIQECRIALSVINGGHENAIYAAGYLHADWLPPKAFFYNGQKWIELQLPEVAERITNMYVESESRIWMCGSNGTLLLGNAQAGFKSLSAVDDNQLFLSICKFQDKIYLGSNLGLFFYDPANHEAGIRKVKTNLRPDLQDANIVDCTSTMLWSIGTKDIARFNGKTWERIQHPDNPRIGD